MLLNKLGFQTGYLRQLLRRIVIPIHSSCRPQCATAHSMMSQVEDSSALRPAVRKLSMHLLRDRKNHIGTHLLVRVQALTCSPSKHGRTPTLVVPPYKLHHILVLAQHASHHHARKLYKSSIRHLRLLHIIINAPSLIPIRRNNRSPCGNTHLRHIIIRSSPTDLTSGRCTTHLRARGSRTTRPTLVCSISMGHQLRRSRSLCSSAC